MLNKTLLITFLAFTLAGCISTKEPVIIETTEEASWAYEFVRVNETSYQLTKKEAGESVKGEPIGEVQRNIVDLDTADDLVEKHLDSNSLPPGTSLYKHTDNRNLILYMLGGKYYIAERKD
ncbi:hypothetical protein M3936_11860 [Sutcliffiella horikoshii]|uniref:hypothetical protein n=1 Tax=Sutcliffiella horikoshii TaxID=79883 RepID=UPI00204253D4|nr:hypothetical protein [Sutcliffiella horikoshii]MCM3618274.1 hypothetical protein [Sutcliffiella horikoshii]